MRTKLAFVLLALSFGIAGAAYAQDSGQSNVPAAGDFHRTYAGKIGGKYSITMDLTKSGTELKGSYKYAGKSGLLALQGSVDEAGEFTMNETNSAGNQTGMFSGRLSGDNISGEWSAPDGSKKLSFDGYKTAEFKSNPKK